VNTPTAIADPRLGNLADLPTERGLIGAFGTGGGMSRCQNKRTRHARRIEPMLTEQQIAVILRQADEGTTVEEVCRRADISMQTYCRWRSKYGV
jgi:hypothetical protein